MRVVFVIWWGPTIRWALQASVPVLRFGMQTGWCAAGKQQRVKGYWRNGMRFASRQRLVLQGAAAVIIVTTFGATSATAIVRNWVGGSSGTFGNPSNWSPAGEPGPSDDAIISGPGNIAIGQFYAALVSDRAVEVLSLAVTGGNVTLDMLVNADQAQNGFRSTSIFRADSLSVAGFTTDGASLIFEAPGTTINGTLSVGTATFVDSSASLSLTSSNYFSSQAVSVTANRLGNSASLDFDSELVTDSVLIGGPTASSGSAVMTVNPAGSLDVDGPLTIEQTGLLDNQSGDVIEATSIDLAGDFSGLLRSTGLTTWRSSAPIDTQVLATEQLQLQTSLSLSGGALRAEWISGPGVIHWTAGRFYTNTGSLNIDQGNPHFGSSLAISPGMELELGGNLGVGVDGSGTVSHTAGYDIFSNAGIIGGTAVTSTGTATVTVSGSGSGWVIANDLFVADRQLAELAIENGGQVQVGGDTEFASIGADANLTIDGTDSAFVGTADARLGGTLLGARGTGQMTLLNGGSFSVGGDLIVYDNYVVDAANGSISFANLDVRGLVELGSQTLDLNTSGDTLALNGGTLRAERIELGQPMLVGSGVIDAAFWIDGDVQATGDLTLGDAGDLNGITIGGLLDVGTHTVTLNRRGFYMINDGGLAIAAGGELVAPGGVLLPAGGSLALVGTIQAPVVTQAGSLVVLNSDLALGDVASPAGVLLGGNIDVADNRLTLHDANEAVLGSLTRLGSPAGDPGEVVAGNGLLVDFGRNITGYGTVQTPDDPFTPLINNGAIIGDSLTEPITLTGYVKGVGSLDNVVITGTDAPGFSPGTSYRGSVGYAGVLQIEIGGLGEGEFDRLLHSGLADLGGLLQIILLDGFQPEYGDSFDFLTAEGGILGQFDQVSGIELGEGLFFDLSSKSNGLQLTVVPEPSTAILFAGLAVALACGRRRPTGCTGAEARLRN
jgi:T5SS/PEP-CTERM-associated repeat protein